MQPTRCRDEAPPLRRLADGHAVACHRAEEIKAKKIQPHKVETVFDSGVQEPEWEPPPV